jgi:hypothetical protein
MSLPPDVLVRAGSSGQTVLALLRFGGAIRETLEASSLFSTTNRAARPTSRSHYV